MYFGPPGTEHIEDVDRKLEDGNVVDVFADMLPSVAKTGQALPPRLRSRLHVLIDLSEPVLEGERVEEDKTTNAEGGGAFFLLIGLGNEVGDSTRYPGVATYPMRGLFHTIPDRPCCGVDKVHTFDVDGQCAKMVDKVRNCPCSDGALQPNCASRAVEPPLKIGGAL